MSETSIRLSPLMKAFHHLKSRGWSPEKVAESEISIEIEDLGVPMNLCILSQEDHQALMVSTYIRLKIPEYRREAVRDLLTDLNAQAWMGHYEIAPEDHLVGYRYNLNLAGVESPSDEQLESMIDLAISECVRLLPALQYILEEGKTASEAAEAAMMQTVGEA